MNKLLITNGTLLAILCLMAPLCLADPPVPRLADFDKAIFAKDYTLAERMLKAGLDLNLKEADGWNPLLWATQQKDETAIRWLVARGARVNISNDLSLTPLLLILSGTSKEEITSIDLLLDRGADVNVEDTLGMTPLMYASAASFVHTTKRLLERGADVHKKNKFVEYSALLCAIKAWDAKPEIVRLLLRNGANPNDRDANGIPALIYTANRKDTMIMRLLVEAGASVKQKDVSGSTVLEVTAREGNLEGLKLLLSHGASLKDPIADGDTLLILAARSGSLDTVRYLVDEGAKVNAESTAQSRWNRTALISAAGSGNAEVVKYLVEKGADVGPQGFEALQAAAYKGDSPSLRYLLAHDADVHIRQAGLHPLLLAALSFHMADGIPHPIFSKTYPWLLPETVQALLGAGIDPNGRDADGQNALLFLSRELSGFYDLTTIYYPVIKELIKGGSDVNAADKSGVTSLMVLCRGFRSTLAALLLENGADAGRKDKDGRTALMYIAMHSTFSDSDGVAEASKPILKLLIEKGANINARDNEGHTALYMANNRRYPHLAELLKSFGAKE